MRISLLLLVSCCFLAPAIAQQPQMVRMPSETESFYQGAKKVVEQKRNIPINMRHRDRLVNGNSQTQWQQFVPLINRGYRLAEKVHEEGAAMDSRTYQSYLRQLQSILTRMDQLQMKLEPATDEPKPGTLGECWKSCQDAVGSGFGGGKGWNRFTCKTGCIITKLPPGS